MYGVYATWIVVYNFKVRKCVRIGEELCGCYCSCVWDVVFVFVIFINIIFGFEEFEYFGGREVARENR